MTRKKLALTVVTIVVLLGAATGYTVLKNNRKITSVKGLTTELTFPVIQPKATSSFRVDQETIKYSESDKVYSYVLNQLGGTKLTVSLQPTPEGFTDAPQVFDKLIEKLRGYSSFDSIQGKVFLTHPVELNGGQTAVMNTKGTLMFVKPEGQLTDDEWKIFFNTLEVVST